MKTYDIINLKNGYMHMVLATSYVNPVDELDEIEFELQDMQFYGKIVFDFLLCNGLNEKRFAEMKFNGEKFDISTFKVLEIDELLRDLKRISSHYFKKNPLFVRNSVLPKAQIYLLKNGEII